MNPAFLQHVPVWSYAQVSLFAQTIVGFSTDEADNLVENEVDLSTFLNMARADIIHITKWTWGKASRLAVKIVESRD